MKEGSTFALCLERNRAWNTEVMQWELDWFTGRMRNTDREGRKEA